MTQWLTPQEAAEHIRGSKDAIRAAVTKGDLPAYRLGDGKRDYRLKVEDVDEWMSSRAWEPAK
jgi:excisionase family DNA binding protein